MAIAFDIDAESRRLDATKPYLELIDGVEVRKAMPMMRHGLLQGEMWRILRDWADSRGAVGTEIRVWLSDSPATPTSLVPDLAFLSYDRLRGLSEEEQQRPRFAPDVCVEIRSPSDRDRNVARKIELYLERGALVVLDVIPKRREIIAHALGGVRNYRTGDTFVHPAVPGLTFDVAAYFASGEIPAEKT